MEKNRKILEFVDASEGRLRSRKKIRSSESKWKGQKTVRFKLDAGYHRNEDKSDVESAAGQHITFIKEAATAGIGPLEGASSLNWVVTNAQERENSKEAVEKIIKPSGPAGHRLPANMVW